MLFKSTKSYYNLPCGHQQWEDDGQCHSTHGYSREIHFEFTAKEVDDYGWVIGFGSLKEVKKWLEFMFDHTSLWEASDPRLAAAKEFSEKYDKKIFNFRILPTGVSMEQSSFFIAQFLAPYIYDITNGRCWISKIEVRENDKNAGIIELDEIDALKFSKALNATSKEDYFPMKTEWEYVQPKIAIQNIIDQKI